jgi:DNA-binding MarR family transcriptional regulator
MNKKFTNLLTNGDITYKEFSICLFIEERMYTANELADKIHTNNKNMSTSLSRLYKIGILNRNEYTKQYSIKE